MINKIEVLEHISINKTFNCNLSQLADLVFINQLVRFVFIQTYGIFRT